MTTSGKLSRFKSDSSIRIIQFVAGTIVVGIVFWQLQFSTSAICCGDFDGYYHIKWTQTLWESIKSGHFRPAFPWLPLTTLNSKDYVDHHLLFHIFQIPFAVSPDPRLGAKIASAIFGGLAVLSCYWLLLRYRVRYALVWLIALLACSAPFLFRMNMAKAPPLALVFTWTYDLFGMLIMATVFWSVTIAITEKRLEWRPLVYITLGCALGL